MDGIISLTLKALSLQLATLMDEAGGESALKLLDKLASLNPQTRKLAIDKFSAELDQILIEDGGNNVYVPGEAEEKIFQSIMSEIDDGSFFSKRKLEVLSGPKNQEKLGDIIDLQAFRQKHRH